MKRNLQSVLFAGLCAAACLPSAASALEFQGIGGRLGLVSPEYIGSTIGIGAHVDLGEMAPAIRLVPSVEYWSKGYFGFTFSELSLNGDVRYYFSQNDQVGFYGGGGLGLFRVKGEYAGVSASKSRVGLNLCGGGDMALSPTMRGFGELRYRTGGSEALDSLALQAGVTFAMGR